MTRAIDRATRSMTAMRAGLPSGACWVKKPYFGASPLGGGERFLEPRHEVVREALGYRRDQSPAVTEVPVENGLGNPRSRRHLVHRRAGADAADHTEGGSD
jgi:hypothetical protein